MDTDTKVAWLAGIIDGEGCISFYWERGKYRRQDGVHNPSLRFQVHVANTDERIINEVLAISQEHNIPCQLKTTPQSVSSHKVRMDAVWQGSKRAQAILRLVLPFLVGKKDRALLCLSVIEHRQSTRSRTQVEVHDDQWLNSQLGEWRRLNRRGVLA